MKQSIFPRARTCTPTHVQICISSGNAVTGQEKGTCVDEKEERRLSLLTAEMTEIVSESRRIHRNLEQSSYGKIAGKRGRTQMSLAFLFTSSKQSRSEILKTIPFMVAPKKSLLYKCDKMCVRLVVKTLPADAGDVEDTGSVAGWGRPLEKGLAAHSSILT